MDNLNLKLNLNEKKEILNQFQPFLNNGKIYKDVFLKEYYNC